MQRSDRDERLTMRCPSQAVRHGLSSTSSAELVDGSLTQNGHVVPRRHHRIESGRRRAADGPGAARRGAATLAHAVGYRTERRGRAPLSSARPTNRGGSACTGGPNVVPAGRETAASAAPMLTRGFRRSRVRWGRRVRMRNRNSAGRDHADRGDRGEDRTVPPVGCPVLGSAATSNPTSGRV
jgi:hypothetical protein